MAFFLLETRSQTHSRQLWGEQLVFLTWLAGANTDNMNFVLKMSGLCVLNLKVVCDWWGAGKEVTYCFKPHRVKWFSGNLKRQYLCDHFSFLEPFKENFFRSQASHRDNRIEITVTTYNKEYTLWKNGLESHKWKTTALNEQVLAIPEEWEN